MIRSNLSWPIVLAVLFILQAHTCRAESLVAFLPYTNAVGSELTDSNLMVVDLLQGLVVEEMEFEGDVRAVDVVDELGTAYILIWSTENSESLIVGLDLQTRGIVFEASLPEGVIGIHVDAEQDRLYAADRYAEELIEIDLATGLLSRRPSGGSFYMVQPVRNSRLLMLTGSDGGRIWDMDQQAFLGPNFGNNRMPLLSRDGETLFVTHYLVGRVSKMNVNTGELLDIANTGVFWTRPELPESGSRINFISGIAAGELDFETGLVTINFGLSDTTFPSVLTSHDSFIVLAEPLNPIICVPTLPCDNSIPPASIYVFDRYTGSLLREVEMPNGGVQVNFGRFLSETARGAPEPVRVPVLSQAGIALLVLLLVFFVRVGWPTRRVGES